MGILTFCMIISLILIVAKVFGAITIGWLICLLPAIIAWAIALIIKLILLIIAVIAFLSN